MKVKTLAVLIILAIYCGGMIAFAASQITGNAISIDADYVTIYPGEQGKISIEVKNNNDFDIEDVSVALTFNTISADGTLISLPLTAIGSSEKEIDSLDEDDEDEATFTLKASTEATPGDYDVPYTISYKNADNESDAIITKQGTFGIRISAKTDLDFSVETKDNIIGNQGKVSLKIINKGLGEIKFVNVELLPEGFELLSSEDVYIGSIDSDDSDLATFDVYFKEKNPKLTAKVTYKDFDNNEHSETVSLPVQVYTREEALDLGLITESKTGIYVVVVVALLVLWIVYRKIMKARKRKKREGK